MRPNLELTSQVARECLRTRTDESYGRIMTAMERFIEVARRPIYLGRGRWLTIEELCDARERRARLYWWMLWATIGFVAGFATRGWLW